MARLQICTDDGELFDLPVRDELEIDSGDLVDADWVDFTSTDDRKLVVHSRRINWIVLSKT